VQQLVTGCRRGRDGTLGAEGGEVVRLGEQAAGRRACGPGGEAGLADERGEDRGEAGEIAGPVAARGLSYRLLQLR
jgi:hypothetical protein